MIPLTQSKKDDYLSSYLTNLCLNIALSIVLINILISIYLKESHKSVTKTYASEALMLVSTIKQDVTNYYYQKGYWPNKTTYEDSTTIIKSISFDGNGGIHVFFTDEEKALQGKRLSFIATTNPKNEISNVIWSCGFNTPVKNYQLLSKNLTNLSKQYLSQMCR